MCFSIAKAKSLAAELNLTSEEACDLGALRKKLDEVTAQKSQLDVLVHDYSLRLKASLDDLEAIQV